MKSLSEQELMKAFLEAKEEAGLPVMKRVRIELEDGYMSASVAVDADMEKVEAEMRASLKAIKDFNALPEADRLKYYLANAYTALRSILDKSGTDVRTIDWSNETEKNLSMTLSGIFGTADMACCMIPTDLRTTDIKIGA